MKYLILLLLSVFSFTANAQVDSTDIDKLVMFDEMSDGQVFVKQNGKVVGLNIDSLFATAWTMIDSLQNQVNKQKFVIRFDALPQAVTALEVDTGYDASLYDAEIINYSVTKDSPIADPTGLQIAMKVKDGNHWIDCNLFGVIENWRFVDVQFIEE